MLHDSRSRRLWCSHRGPVPRPSREFKFTSALGLIGSVFPSVGELRRTLIPSLAKLADLAGSSCRMLQQVTSFVALPNRRLLPFSFLAGRRWWLGKRLAAAGALHHDHVFVRDDGLQGRFARQASGAINLLGVPRWAEHLRQAASSPCATNEFALTSGFTRGGIGPRY
jgi:hypothetical protein